MLGIWIKQLANKENYIRWQEVIMVQCYTKGTDFTDRNGNHSLLSVDSGCWAIGPCCTLWERPISCPAEGPETDPGETITVSDAQGAASHGDSCGSWHTGSHLQVNPEERRQKRKPAGAPHWCSSTWRSHWMPCTIRKMKLKKMFRNNKYLCQQHIRSIAEHLCRQIHISGEIL